MVVASQTGKVPDIAHFHPYYAQQKADAEAQKRADALIYHLRSLEQVPEDKFDAALDRFFNRERGSDE